MHNRVLAVEYQQQTMHNRVLAVGYQQQTLHNRVLAVGYQQTNHAELGFSCGILTNSVK